MFPRNDDSGSFPSSALPMTFVGFSPAAQQAYAAGRLAALRPLTPMPAPPPPPPVLLNADSLTFSRCLIVSALLSLPIFVQIAMRLSGY